MIEEENNEKQSLTKIYMSSRSSAFSQACNNITSIFTVKSALNRKMRTVFRAPNNTFMLSVTLLISLMTSLSLLGFLDNNIDPSPTIRFEIHSGYWDTIPPQSSTNRSYTIKNTSEHPLQLELRTQNWNPADAILYVRESWDYDGSPLLPGEEIDISITLKNEALDSTIFTNLDIIINGFQTTIK